MKEMNRNEFFIRNILEVINQMTQEQLGAFLKDYIEDIDLKESEKNSLYGKCVNELKKIEKNSIKEYCEAAESICNYYLELSIGKRYYKNKYDNEFRKEKYKQLNMDIPKEIMEEFEYYIEKNKDTKKAIIVEAINNYIDKNKKEEEKEK